MFKSIIILITSVFLLPNLAAQPAVDESFAVSLRQTLEQSFQVSHGVGVSAALIMPDGKMWQGVCGISAPGVPVSQDMLFDIGSAEKNLQAALTLKLAEEGVLSLDDHLGKWLPAYPNINPGITIRQLLNQTDGVDGFVGDANSPWRAGYGNIEYTKKWTPAEIFATFVGKPLFEPGKGWAYSQTNYILLRMIIEKATGSKIHAELSRRLLQPLGMDHTTANLLDPPPPRLTIAHGWLDEFNDGHIRDIHENSLNWLATFSPMLTYSSAGDMARWIHALLHEKRVLSKPMLEEMLTFVTTSPAEPLMTGYGLGLVRYNMGLLNPKMAGVTVLGHSGSEFGYTAIAIYLPEHGVSLALMVNRGCDGEANQAVGTVLNALLDLVMERITPRTEVKQENPRIGRVLGGLQVIDFTKSRQTGESASLADRMAFYKTPGVSISLIDDNAIAWEKGSGVLKAGSPDPVDGKSIFEAGSVSKFVTALLVLHFVEKGVLDLDSDVNGYLTSWKIPENGFTKNKKVTLRCLLSHQSGIPAQNRLEDSATLIQILSGTKPAVNPPAVPEFEPGSRWNYSNIGYAVIQLILEDVTGKPFARLAEAVIFKPLGMTSSTFSYPLGEQLRPFEAMPHATSGSPRVPSQASQARTPGGLLCTTRDMAILTIEIMKAYQGKSARIISPETAKLLVSKQIKVPTEALGIPLSNGLGVFIDDTTEELCFLHPGHNYPGSVFLMIAYPALGKGAIIAVNGNIGDRLYLEILASIAIEYGWPGGQPYKG